MSNRIKLIYGDYLETKGIKCFPEEATNKIINNYKTDYSNINSNKTNNQFYRKNFARESDGAHKYKEGSRSSISLKINKKDAIKNIESKLK